jgi:hypothetical protein
MSQGVRYELRHFDGSLYRVLKAETESEALTLFENATFASGYSLVLLALGPEPGAVRTLRSG